MSSVEAYYLREHSRNPIILASPVDVDALIDQVRPDAELEAPTLVNLYLMSDPYEQTLAIGVQTDRGVVRYAGREWPGGVVSTNGEERTDIAIPYSYQDHPHEFHNNSEIPLDLVRQAVNEFMATDGARPTCIPWQPDRLAELLLSDTASDEEIRPEHRR